MVQGMLDAALDQTHAKQRVLKNDSTARRACLGRSSVGQQ